MTQEEKRLIQNKYEIVSKIKQGGFGIVYKGYDHVFEKPIAIKAIEPGLLREAKYIDLFLEEAKNAGKLSHNNIVHIYNLVRDENGQFFIIMEYVDGVDLGKILRVCKKKDLVIPQELSIFIIKEICKALEYAHNKRDLMTDKPLRLVHQDISPSNIMISLSGHVKLIDFGLAKIRLSSNNSNEIVLSGKLPYMAPEQVNSGYIDRRTDIFSLGTVFYEMLTGLRLYPLKDPQETIELIKKGKVDTSILDRNNVVQAVQQVLLKMLQKNPENRYHGANGVYLDLVECLMSSTHSVELSNELGNFVHQLFDVDGGGIDDDSVIIQESESAFDNARLETYPEKTVEIPPGDDEDRVASNKPGTFEIKEPEFQNHIFQQKKPKTVSLAKTIDVKKEDKARDIGTGDAAELFGELMDTSSMEPIEPVLEKNKDGDFDLPESFLESEIKLMPGEEDEAQLNEGAAVENGRKLQADDEPTVSSKVTEVDDVLTGETNKIFDIGEELQNIDVIHEQSRGIEQRAEHTQKIAATPTTPSIYSEEEGEDDLKTVIDVIRLSTKRHKKILTIGGASVLGALLLFLIFDIMLQLTSLGDGIYNRLFPPAIRIASIPTGAIVYIDNKSIPGKTPLSIPKISPGVHELRLAYTGFTPLIKSIHVPGKGEVKVTGEKARKGYDPYLFQFKSQIEINSEPSDATIYINQLLYPQKTPTTIEWEAGKPLSIELEQEGFQKISGFTLNTLEGIEEIEDRRLWSIHSEAEAEESRKYVVKGMFKKFFTISCIPSGATFYIDGSPNPAGRTDVSSTIALTMGQHEILFKKTGFNSRTIRVDVDKDGTETISVMLTRNVRFFAKDKNDPGDNEIGATIVKIIQNNRSYRRNDRTPCEISLPPVNLQVVLSKNGYNDARVNITAHDKDVVVRMEPSVSDVEVQVSDALTGLPLKDAQISYRPLNNDRVSEEYFGATNENGICVKTLAPGEYSFKVKKFGYFEKYSNLNTKTGNNKLEFKLIIQ